MGTALGANTRRYHGLLIAAARPPVLRILALHSVLERLTIGGRERWLAAMQFAPLEEDASSSPLLLHPDGWRHLREVEIDTLGSSSCRVQWTWRLGDHDEVAQGTVRRTLELLPGRNAARLTYELRGLGGAMLHLRLMTPLRDFHALDHEIAAPVYRTIAGDDGLRVRRDEFELSIRASAGVWEDRAEWWQNFAYAADRERGQEWMEDVYSPGELAMTIDDDPMTLVLEVELSQPGVDVPAIDSAPIVAGDDVGGFDATLRRAAEQFVVRRQIGGRWSTSIIAGYPWFADWGRDSMISLEGLLLIDDRFEEARDLLRLYAAHARRGLIPNRFDDWSGEPHYNTVDASLWFVHAVGALHRRAPAMMNEALLEACRSIIAAYCEGTDFEIRMDEDGLIAAGSPETQLTWMDAQRDGVTFTPRHGKAIEINALWHHALHITASLTSASAEAAELRELAERVAASIRLRFWWPERACCHDVLIEHDGGWAGDAMLRPNQIFAVSLDPSPLEPAQQRTVVAIVREHLLTLHGVRTLDPDHARYRGRYEGDLMQRDAAYHQGTAWPWLLGPLGEAMLRAGGFSDAARAEVRAMIEPMLAELDRGCRGQLAEVYDGDPPQRASGCLAQAWTIAELRRLLAMVSVETSKSIDEPGRI